MPGAGVVGQVTAGSVQEGALGPGALIVLRGEVVHGERGLGAASAEARDGGGQNRSRGTQSYAEECSMYLVLGLVVVPQRVLAEIDKSGV